MTPELKRILDTLCGVKQTSNGGYEARCPAHEDQHASLSVSRGDDGRVLLHCHAGCAPIDVCKAMGLRLGDLFPPSNNGDGLGRIVATYDYCDAKSDLLFQVLRYEGKEFRQRRPDGNGGWIWKLGRTPRVLYRLPELLAAGPDEYVFVAEGEKDVDRLASAGLIATCNPGGAGKWNKLSDDSVLHDRRVAIIADKDEAGRKHAADVAMRLRNRAAEIRIVELPGAGKDASDWLASGGTPEQLNELIEAAPSYSPPATPAPGKAVTAADDSLPCTELQFGERLARFHADKLRFCHSHGWLNWTGTHWKRDDSGTAAALAKQTVKATYAMLTNVPDCQYPAAFKAIRSFEYNNRIRGILSLAESEPALRVAADALDKGKYLFNCTNGTYDLDRDEFREHRQADLLTKCAGVKFNPNARAPRWEQFLGEIFAGDAALIGFMQRVCGYCLSGDTSEQCWFLLHGAGDNGKSTILSTLQKLHGDYSHQASAATFMQQHNPGIRNDVAALDGKRFVSSVEVADGRRLDGELVKQLTGGDRITARFLYNEYFEFVPACKLFIACNHKPTVRDTSHATWRRIRLIPFTVQIPEADKDPHLAHKLAAELPGILTWCLAGFRAWKRDGLQAPDVVRAATRDYRVDSNILAGFLADRCQQGAGLRISSKALFADYLESTGEKTTKLAFNQRMREAGYTLGERSTGGQRYWAGLGLAAEESD